MKDIRIACYGFVDKNSGSCTKAHFLVLEELAKRGVKIDFFGWRGFNLAEELECHPNFRYVDLPSASPVNLWMEKLPSKVSKTVYPFINILFNNKLHYRAMKQTILEKHSIESYDILFFLGLYAPFDFKPIPVVSLIQGAPGSEWTLIHKHKKTIIKFCGRILYAKLKIYYMFKDKSAYAQSAYSNAVISPSQWTKSEVTRSGFNSDNIYVIPYPLELDRFSRRVEITSHKLQREKTLLCLGRLDPRKRLDLLLDAFALVLQERNDVRLKVIGSFNYVLGYAQMLEKFPFPDKLEYQDSVSQTQVPEIMRSCDLLIQPSEGENFGSSVAEALCCGLPVIVGSTNGTKDYLGDSSFVFEEYTAEVLKSTIIKALDAIDKNSTMLANQARRAAEEHFAASDIVDSLQDALNEVLHEKKDCKDDFVNSNYLKSRGLAGK
jgi:glycosyltransferase involved in cell wall biosynthesis